MRKLKTRAQFQAMMAHLPVAKTPHFVLYRLPAGPATPLSGTADLDVDGAYLPVADFKEAQRAFAVCSKNGATSTDHLWLGALVPKRWAKHAVTRNLVRRQIAAIVVELHRQHSLTTDAPFATSTFLVRMRDGFHAKKAAPKAKNPKARAGQQPVVPAKVPEKPRPHFSSASSCDLKQEVRQELLMLFSRANKAPLAHRKQVDSV